MVSLDTLRIWVTALLL